MTGLDPDIEDILEEQVEDFHLKRLIRQTLDWEDQRLYQTVRRGKKDALEGFLDDHLEDRQ